MISTRIAVERERQFWRGLDFTNRAGIKVKAQARDGRFTLRLTDHVDALDDESVLVSSALVLSYSLAESAILDRLGLDSRKTSGVEDWGSRLLQTVGREWSDVEAGRAGAVEVGVVRNLIVHGVGAVDAKSHARLIRAGCDRFAVGDPVVLNHDVVGEYRARLRSLLTVGGLGEPCRPSAARNTRSASS
jgi:hypothetical protein